MKLLKKVGFFVMWLELCQVVWLRQIHAVWTVAEHYLKEYGPLDKDLRSMFPKARKESNHHRNGDGLIHFCGVTDGLKSAPIIF